MSKKLTKKPLTGPQKLWIKALRSGKYKQTTGQLKDEYAQDKKGDEFIGHCCLGVACELAVQKGIIQYFDGGEGDLPYKVTDWLGLSDNVGSHGESGNDLTDLNDNKHWSFKSIANFIEKRPKGLFKGE